MVSTTLVTLNSSTFFNKMENYSQPIILFYFLTYPSLILQKILNTLISKTKRTF